MNLIEVELEKTLSPFARRPLVVSTSGGVDSMVLLEATWRYKPDPIQAFHYNFKIRGQAADADAQLVKDFCNDRGIPLLVKEAPVTGKKSQEDCRKIRLEALEKSFLSSSVILEAHHRDDLIETVLFRLFRGSGFYGLSGISPSDRRGSHQVLRPFLSLSKADLYAYAEQKMIPFREDRSNQESTYDRNWIRNELLPQIRQRFAGVDGAVAGLAAEAALFREENERQQEAWENAVILSKAPLTIDGNRLSAQSPGSLCQGLHGFFRRRLQIFVERRHILELCQKIRTSEPFSFNLPRQIVIRRGRDARMEFFEGPGAIQRMRVTN